MWKLVNKELPPLGVPIIIRTDYGKCDICHLRIDENNKLEWVNDMRPQHTNGSVELWHKIPK